ncbi:MAG: phosphatase PAP2 family protein [Xanthobacteraceae bacterium]
MTRAALFTALAIGSVFGLLCAVDPQLDLDLAALSFDSARHLFVVNAQPWVQHTRTAARILIALLALPAFLAIVLKLIWPHRRMLIEARAALFLIATLALGPGLLTNVVLKDHWGRPRPIDVQQFGGDLRFEPWWDPRGECRNNCSFIAGEPSGAFWTLAPAALAPPPLQAVAYGAALAFGIGLGAFRMAAGAHFFSDVVFAGVLMYLVVFIAHGLIYRWPATRLDEKALADRLSRCGEWLAGALRGAARRLAGGSKKPS